MPRFVLVVRANFSGAIFPDMGSVKPKLDERFEHPSLEEAGSARRHSGHGESPVTRNDWGLYDETRLVVLMAG
jgi:hypothetical protein